MTQEERAKGIAGAQLSLAVAIESEPRLMGEPLNVILGCISDMLQIVADANNGLNFDAMRMLIDLGQIGTQTTKAPEFWKVTR